MSDVQNAPALPAADWTPEVTRTIQNMIEYTKRLAGQYGYGSEVYRESASSLINGISNLLMWGGRIWRDSEYGLCGNSNGMVYGILPHFSSLPDGVSQDEDFLRPVSWSFHS